MSAKNDLLRKYREEPDDNADWLDIFADFEGFDALKSQRKVSRNRRLASTLSEKKDIIQEMELSLEQCSRVWSNGYKDTLQLASGKRNASQKGNIESEVSDISSGYKDTTAHTEDSSHIDDKDKENRAKSHPVTPKSGSRSVSRTSHRTKSGSIYNIDRSPSKNVNRTPSRSSISSRSASRTLTSTPSGVSSSISAIRTPSGPLSRPISRTNTPKSLTKSVAKSPTSKPVSAPRQRPRKPYIQQDSESSFIDGILERYDIKEQLGKGAFATVFKATNKSTGKSIAIKQVILDPDHDPTALMSEIHLLKSLSHRNIVKYHGFVQKNSRLNIFLEYCAGGSLRDLLKRNKPKNPASFVLTETSIKYYLRQVLDGLYYLHQQNVVHRDIKAANILLTSDNVVKLADFGVSTKVSVQTVVESAVAGTPNWMAPETIQLEKVTTAADIWSLGALVIELVTGKPPYSGLNPMAAMHAIVTDKYPAIPEISENGKNFLFKCFEKKPMLRASAKELRQHCWLAKKSSDISRYIEEDQDWEKDFEDLEDLVGRMRVRDGRDSS